MFSFNHLQVVELSRCSRLDLPYVPSKVNREQTKAERKSVTLPCKSKRRYFTFMLSFLVIGFCFHRLISDRAY